MSQIEKNIQYPLGVRAYWFLLAERSGTMFLFFLFALSFQLIKWNVDVPFITVAFLNLFTQVAIGLAILAEITALFITQLQYGVSRIMISDFALHITRGVLHKYETILPFRRIQSMEMRQNILQRMYGVGHVVISKTTDLDHSDDEEDGSQEEEIPFIDYRLGQGIIQAITQKTEIERIRMEQ